MNRQHSGKPVLAKVSMATVSLCLRFMRVPALKSKLVLLSVSCQRGLHATVGQRLVPAQWRACLSLIGEGPAEDQCNPHPRCPGAEWQRRPRAALQPAVCLGPRGGRADGSSHVYHRQEERCSLLRWGSWLPDSSTSPCYSCSH